ncbi:unnamed protein product, partial [Didymodactylos carnosus]
KSLKSDHYSSSEDDQRYVVDDQTHQDNLKDPSSSLEGRSDVSPTFVQTAPVLIQPTMNNTSMHMVSAIPVGTVLKLQETSTTSNDQTPLLVAVRPVGKHRRVPRDSKLMTQFYHQATAPSSILIDRQLYNITNREQESTVH